MADIGSVSTVAFTIPVKCNIHAWMKAYIAVLDSPYFAVTGKDGSFAIHNVPPGAYTLTAWHETYGPCGRTECSEKGSKIISLSFKAGGSTVDVTNPSAVKQPQS